MNTILVILLVLAMIATVAALVRGVVALLRTKEQELMSGSAGPSASGLQQNKAMRARLMFQALAIVIVVLLLLLRR